MSDDGFRIAENGAYVFGPDPGKQQSNTRPGESLIFPADDGVTPIEELGDPVEAGPQPASKPKSETVTFPPLEIKHDADKAFLDSIGFYTDMFD